MLKAYVSYWTQYCSRKLSISCNGCCSPDFNGDSVWILLLKFWMPKGFSRQHRGFYRCCFAVLFFCDVQVRQRASQACLSRYTSRSLASFFIRPSVYQSRWQTSMLSHKRSIGSRASAASDMMMDSLLSSLSQAVNLSSRTL